MPTGSWQSALGESLRHPSVWAPLAGAALVAVADVDDEWSENAIDDQPVFGDDAQDLSDKLRDATTIFALGSALAAPAENWAARGERLGVNLGVMLVEGALTTGLKEATGRERPDELGDRSFPSGHTAQAASRMSLTAHNLAIDTWDPLPRRAMQVGVLGMTAATGWARVEAAKHFPSDVLVGAALGNLVANFAERWWRPVLPAGAMLRALPSNDGVIVRLELPLRGAP